MDRRVVVPLAILLTSCVWTFQSLEVAPLDRHAGDSVVVISPVKAHLADGSTVVFPNGVDVVRDTLIGDGMRYSLTLRDSAAVQTLALDSVTGVEVFRTRVDVGMSVVVTVLATGAAAAATVGAAIAIFGSCPTYYVDSAGTYLLEGEGFSYSIAPLFEARDVDRLRIHTAPDGTVRLEVRNEALETHYVNHLELLEVEHAASETVVGDEANRLLIVHDLAAPTRAVDRTGRDVRRDVAAADGEPYRSDPGVIAGARLDDLEDWIDVALPAPMAAESVAIVFRLRNSLLNTILLYDIMLGDPGARSLDWVGRDLQQVGPAVELAQWYQHRMGLDVTVAAGNGGGYRFITHIKDTGPIAWKDVSVVVPVLERGRVRVRLRFPADNWRIDRIAVAGRFRRAVPLIHPLSEVRDADGKADRAALASLVAADPHYLETTAGQRFTAGFAVPSTAAAGRTFFLASQGYYSEWVRRDWLTAPRVSSGFVPSDAALLEAIGRWRATQETLEARFMASRIPVR